MTATRRIGHRVCSAAELPPGSRKIIEVNGQSIGVFNVGGRYYAVQNRCPHRGAPLCQGMLTGLVTSGKVYVRSWERDGEILRCPWHGWEFDVTTGKSVFLPEAIRAKSYAVAVEAAVETYDVMDEQGSVVVLVGEGRSRQERDGG